ncbi:PREDICTED: sentrin-specific protease 8-like [Nicrophorus vespilloides]|uniref:Sentrin-specific protease 8-like n=1 Tax=Nicrophorus vespilloides TaxID=110193 RepID=A0ABM1M4L3_NICVS|nr:PREDICTED: sentrin-specific protease 8-like [Nicrophorus vespilloides]
MSNNPVVLNFHESLLRVSDVELLTGPSWLNDTVISFYFEYLEVRKFKNNPTLLFVPPQVTQCVKITPVQEISVFLNPLDSGTKDFIFFALNDNEQTEVSGGTHWSLLVFSYPEKKIYHFDSSHGSNQYQAMELGSKILLYFGINHCDRIYEPKCLQQNNGYDCGIHVLAQCEHLANFALKHRKIETCPALERETVQMKRRDILNLINSLRKPRTYDG